MIVTVDIVGDDKVIARLESMPPAVNQALYVKVLALALKLEAYIKTRKLDGQVLNRKSGALSRSIQNRVERSLQSVMGFVFSAGDVKYAAIHEYGGKTSPHIIRAKNAKMLAFMGKGGTKVFAKQVNHPGSKMPMRSYMRTGLSDMTAEISTGMKEAVVRAVIAQVKG